jgi:ubiquitin-protein ligase
LRAGEASEAIRKQNDGIWSKPILEDDLMKWESLVLGPALSPYAYGFFTVIIFFVPVLVEITLWRY